MRSACVALCALDVGEFNAGNATQHLANTHPQKSRAGNSHNSRVAWVASARDFGSTSRRRRRAACGLRQASRGVTQSTAAAVPLGAASERRKWICSLAAPLALYKRAATTLFNCILCARWYKEAADGHTLRPSTLTYFLTCGPATRKTWAPMQTILTIIRKVTVLYILH
jgi:hypothetical protein